MEVRNATVARPFREFRRLDHHAPPAVGRRASWSASSPGTCNRRSRTVPGRRRPRRAGPCRARSPGRKRSADPHDVASRLFGGGRP
jgi:hypothetical protein